MHMTFSASPESYMYERILLCYLRADLDVAGDCTAAEPLLLT